MSNHTFCLHVPAAALTLAFLTSLTLAATTSDQPAPAQKQHPAKPMIKKEPMAGGMKKDGMMKEDVSKAAQKWDAKMEASMKQASPR